MVEQGGHGHGDRAGEDGDERGGGDPAGEVAPSGKRGGSPAFEHAGLPGGNEAHSVGVPGGEGEPERRVSSHVGGRRVVAGGDEEDDWDGDADGDGAAVGQQQAP